MFAIPSFLLSGAWWVAKALGAKATVGRFLNKEAASALAIGGAVVAVVVGLVWATHAIYAAGEASGTASMRADVAAATLSAIEARAALEKAADAAAAKARAAAADDLEASRARAADLEKAIASLKGERRVVYPRAIAKELNR